MSVAKNEVIQMEYNNPDAQSPLFVPVLVICNTPDKVLGKNIRINSAKSLRWLMAEKEHEGVAIMVGGGASIENNIEEIKQFIEKGGTVFAMNAASHWLRSKGIEVDYQCILDAKPESALLVDTAAHNHLIGSQVDPVTMDSVTDPIVWHLEIGDIEQFFPEERKRKGGYALLGGGAAVGNSAMCAAYALGFRKFHVFGYDSSHKDGRSHAYPQDMNIFIPTTKVEWAGKKFTASVAMKAQAEKFQMTSFALDEAGCEIEVYGEGLLQTMFHAKHSELTEQQKYQSMWQFDLYRRSSPGEDVADTFYELARPDGMVIDLGCGTGRGSKRLHELGCDVLLMDFADNCRDEEAMCLPFIQADLTKGVPVSAPYGFCTDVMEHIEPINVERVLRNIRQSVKKVFFQISLIDDACGALIGHPLHLSVHPFKWWEVKLKLLGFDIVWSEDQGEAALFYVTTGD